MDEDARRREIDLFWDGTLALARLEPLSARIERVPERVPYEVHRLTYRSLDGVPVRAYLAKPILGEGAGRRLPAVVTAPGYGGREFGTTLAECRRGAIVLQVYPRSQGESGDLWKVDEGSYGAWIRRGLGHREGFYYQGAVMDLVRAVDCLLEREDVLPDRIGAMGTSQGGYLALCLGAVDERIRAVVSHVPYLCDLRHNAAFASLERGKDAPTADVFDFFDPVHLAHRLRKPVLLSSGGRDTTCPPETIRAVFDRLPGIRSLAHYPELAHTSCGDFFEMGWEWMQRHLMRA